MEIAEREIARLQRRLAESLPPDRQFPEDPTTAEAIEHRVAHIERQVALIKRGVYPAL